MSELTTKRTLVKSPPELWAEVSDLEALAKHLGEFGEIRITRLEPETTVVWEGDRACGTVKLEPSGWGTKVTLTAELAAIEEAVAAEEPAVTEVPVAVAENPVATQELPADPEPLPEPVAIEEPPPAPIEDAEPPVPEPKVGFWGRLFAKRRRLAAEVPPPEPTPAPTPPPIEEPEPEPAPVEEPPAPEPPPLQPAHEPEPEPEPEEPLPAAEEPFDGDRAVAVLTGVLDNLGAAHHRPFSRG
jgi:hypothetical protein